MNRTELDELPPVLDVPTATILHRAFRDAVRWNLLIRNPCDLADPPRARPAEQVRERTWTSGDVARFLRLTSPAATQRSGVSSAPPGCDEAKRSALAGTTSIWRRVDSRSTGRSSSPTTTRAATPG